MSLLVWSDDYLTGYSDIDNNQKQLFFMVNGFFESNDETASYEVLSAFLEELLKYSINHFKLEEQYMKKSKYPLLKHHKASHKNLHETVYNIKKQMLKGKHTAPYDSIFMLASDWLNNHVHRYDIIFAAFCANQSVYMDKKLSDKDCQVYTMSNILLYNGYIKSVVKSRVIIKLDKDKKPSIMPTDMLKVSLGLNEHGEQIFFSGIVYYVSPSTIKMINPTIVREENKRKFFRISTEIDALLRSNEVNLPVKIIDMSSSGMRVESDHEFHDDDVVPINFDIDNNRMMILCKIVRISGNEEGHYTYGLKHHYLSSADEDKLNAYILSNQLLEREE